jgi:predicted MFS family arabinose efflux permease
MNARSTAFKFLIMIGVANLFADLTYEGARSAIGPFMAQLGATAAIVSIVSGFGEFAGYALRAVVGYIADRTGRYWTLTVVGYAINMLAVPALALAGSWPAAAGLVVAERTGRAIRRPVVEGMVSHTRKQVGGGLAFGLNESLDQAGATVGPLVIALVLARHGDYRTGFAALLISALLCLGMVIATQQAYPHPEQFETTSDTQAKEFPRAYWLYLAGSAMIGFGFVDFSLIAFHFQKTGAIAGTWIPISYAVAMGSGAIGNVLLGSLFDKIGFGVLIGVFLIGSFFTPLVFFGKSALAVLGMALWGINMGAQDTLLKPAIAPLIAAGRRTTAFGLFDTSFGAAWLVGSIAFGLLYGKSLPLLVVVSVVGQLVSLPIFVFARYASQRSSR